MPSTSGSCSAVDKTSSLPISSSQSSGSKAGLSTSKSAIVLKVCGLGLIQNQSIMASSAYGRKLNPYRHLCDPLGVKGVRQSVVVTNNPSTIDQNQQLLVWFPNLGAHDVNIPGTVRLAFTVSLTSTDANRTVVQNLGRAIVKKMTIKISGNEVLSIDNSDVFHCYQDLWKTAQERSNSQ